MSQQDAQQVGRAGLLFLCGTIVALLSGVLLRVFLARVLPASEFGRIFVFLSILNIISIPCLLGLNQGVTKFVSDERLDKDERNSYITVSLIAVSFVSLLLSLALSSQRQILIEYFPDITVSSATILALMMGTPAYCILVISRNALRGFMDSTSYVLLDKIYLPIARLVLVSILVIIFVSAAAAIIGILFSLLSAAALGLFLLLRSGWRPTYNSSIDVPRLFRFSFPLVISSSVYVLLSHFDKLAIEYFINSSSVGQYEVVVTIATQLLLFHSAFSFLVFPKISELVSSNNADQINSLYQQSTKWILVFTTPVFSILLFIPEPLIAIFGAKYISANLQVPLAIFATGIFLDAVSGPNGEALLGFERSKAVLIYNMIAVFVNIVLNIFLIPEYGLVGAAIATFIGYTFMNGLKTFDLYVKHDIIAINKSAVVMSLTSLVLALVTIIVIPTPEFFIWELIVAIFLGIIVFLGAIVMLAVLGGVTEDDLDLIVQIASYLPIESNKLSRIMRKLRG